VTCWSCHGATAQGTPFCGACRKLQPVGRTEDAYALFDLPRQFALEPGQLEQRFRDLSRLLHPDRFARAEPRERRIALERATRLNDAYRALKDWRRRAADLLKLAGHDVFGDGRTSHDPEFLEEQLAWREGLALARADGDTAALVELAARGRARLAALEAECGRLFEEQDWFSESVWEIARRLARARYYDNIIADAERGAGPPGLVET
jgi:molecular chaperone HscB